MVFDLITRKEWNAMPPKETRDLSQPIKKVAFTVCNITDPCFTKEECMANVKHIQNHFSDIGLEDIPYNFLVGNDGNVYEGRGWYHKPGPSLIRDIRYRDHTLEIGIICGHKRSVPGVKEMMMGAFGKAKEFVKYGIAHEMIIENYEYVGFNTDNIPDDPPMEM